MFVDKDLEVSVDGALSLSEMSPVERIINQINEIVPGSPAKDIVEPSLLAKLLGGIASLSAKFLIWLDSSLYSMFSWWGGTAVTVLHFFFHAALTVCLGYAMSSYGFGGRYLWLAPPIMVAMCILISLPLQFLLYAFEFSLMGEKERLITSFESNVTNDIRGEGGRTLYAKGDYEVSAFTDRPKMHRCAYYWPLITLFASIEFVAHFLLVFRDYALGNRYGTFILLPEDWVEYYKEVPLKEYRNFVPEHFIRRLEQVVKEHSGETYVLIPFGLMPGHLPDINQLEGAQIQWNAHLRNLERPKGDPVLAVKLDDETKFGRMLVVGHWMTLATLQKCNLLFHHFELKANRIEEKQPRLFT